MFEYSDQIFELSPAGDEQGKPSTPDTVQQRVAEATFDGKQCHKHVLAFESDIRRLCQAGDRQHLYSVSRVFYEDFRYGY